MFFKQTSNLSPDFSVIRFGNEEAQRRQRQQEKERAKRDQAAADAANAAKAMRKVKHTQASIGKF